MFISLKKRQCFWNRPTCSNYEEVLEILISSFFLNLWGKTHLLSKKVSGCTDRIWYKELFVRHVTKQRWNATSLHNYISSVKKWVIEIFREWNWVCFIFFWTNLMNLRIWFKKTNFFARMGKNIGKNIGKKMAQKNGGIIFQWQEHLNQNSKREVLKKSSEL